MKTLRIGLIGAGFAARYHVECLRRVYGVHVELAAVTSRRAESRKAFGDEHNIKPYDSVQAMLDDVDAIDICSTPDAHEQAIIAAARAGKAIFCEKPLSGYFGPADDETFRGNQAPKKPMLDAVVARLTRIADAVRDNNAFFAYGENFVYAPSIQKEREIIEKTGAQVLRMTGEESHNGSHSKPYGRWSVTGGGSLVGKGVHPLGGMLYIKRIEGLARNGKPIRPKTVTARVHELTRLPDYRDAGFIRTDYHDIEDFGIMHVVFEDGTIADAITCEIVLGGLYDYLEVFANNHRTRCNISPIDWTNTYNPKAEQFDDIYLVEKLSSREGWSPAAPDENITVGYQPEIQDFVYAAATGQHPQSDLDLALDTTATVYAAYVSNENQGRETDIPML